MDYAGRNYLVEVNKPLNEVVYFQFNSWGLRVDDSKISVLLVDSCVHPLYYSLKFSGSRFETLGCIKCYFDVNLSLVVQSQIGRLFFGDKIAFYFLAVECCVHSDISYCF